jgi:hypothetical protein
VAQKKAAKKGSEPPQVAISSVVPATAIPLKSVSLWVKLFVAFHVFAITVWALPRPADAILKGKQLPVGTDWLLFWNARYLKESMPERLYCGTTGLWQYWDMFSPNPAQIDFWGDAEVVYQDGKHIRYQYPRIYLLPLPQKYPYERFRKYYERAHTEGYKFLWPLFAQRIALLCDTDKANPPVKVVLRRHWRPVAAPGKVQQVDYNQFDYFTYAVDEERLRADEVKP